LRILARCHKYEACAQDREYAISWDSIHVKNSTTFAKYKKYFNGHGDKVKQKDHRTAEARPFFIELQ